MIGQTIGSYQILSKLGEGGMGEVYRARDSRLGREVALKVLPPDVTSDPTRLERFDREARAIAALNHPHIVTIYSTEQAGDVRFLTMELVEGDTLTEHIASGAMPLQRFLDIALALADALSAAHQKQITHRDLKPGNVMVSREGRVKVLDFGLARIGGTELGEHSLAATRAPITHLGMIVGTMPYMSPEQVEGRPLDPRTDLFSLGVIFYELLNGERPFKGDSSPALMSSILRDTPTNVSDTRADVPEALARLVARLLEKRPEDRVQTARDVYNELRHAQKQLESGARSSSSSARAASAVSETLCIVVLPFSVRGTDADSDAIALGLTEDVTTSLAKFRGLSVAAQQTARTFKDSAQDVRHIAERLGARYVVGGSVRKSGTTVRVTAQLIDAHSATQLWTETYDRRLEGTDIFAIQDDVTDHIVATVADVGGVLASSMVQSIRQRTTVEQSTAEQLMLRGWGFQVNPNPVDHAELRTALEAMTASEPENAEVWATLASVYMVEHSLLFNPLPDPLGRALRAARRAIEIDRSNQHGWQWLAIVSFYLRDRAGFEEASARAMRINPRNAHTAAWVGAMLTHAGEYDRGCALTERAMAINAGHPGWLHFSVFNRHFARGEYAEALTAARRVNIPQFFWMHFAIAAATGHLGRAAEGKSAVAAMIRIAPPLGDDAMLREFVTRWYWPPDLIESLLEGVGMSKAAGTSLDTAPPSSSERAKPPSSISSTSPSRSNALSLAILPFVARSTDEDSTALAAELSHDIASGLSRFGYLRVLSRARTEQLAGKPSDLPSFARYSLEGQVRRAGTMIRINVTLADTRTDSNLWTEQYDRDAAAGLFAVQDDVVSRIVATVGDQSGMLARAIATAVADRPVDELTVAELVIRFFAQGDQYRADEHSRLRAGLERALEREPRAAEGWACLATLYQQELSLGLNPLPDASARERRAAERAVEIDPQSQLAWTALAGVHVFARDQTALRDAVERAVALNPLNSDLVALNALFLSWAGDDDRAVELARTAIARKPQHPGWYHFPLCNSHYLREEYEAAFNEAKRINMPTMPFALMGAALTAGRLGRREDVRLALDGLRRLDPQWLDPSRARQAWSRFWNQAFLDRMVEDFATALALDAPANKTSGSSAGSHDATVSSTPSVAVLPFTDLSPTKDQDWFCDGIAEEILNALSPLPGLHVAARASTFSLRGNTDDLRVIGDKLNVKTVLEGSVRRAGDRVRITAQLSDVEQGRQLWSERFDRELKDIFDVQEEIARAIVERLKVTLADDGRERLVPKATAIMGAYELLLKGRVLLTRRGRAILEAMKCFEDAVALDPNLSEAHALLGDAFRLTALYGLVPAHDAMPRARASAERALAIDPNQVEALATLANIASTYDWDMAASVALSDRALAVDPSHVRAMAERAISLVVRQSPTVVLQREIFDHLQRARALDPLSAWVMSVESMCLACVGRVPEAVAVAERAVAADEHNFTARWTLVVTLAWSGRDAEAEAATAPALAMSGRHPRILTELAAIHAGRGDAAAAEAIHVELRDRASTGHIGIAEQACAAASAGHFELARDLIVQAIAARDPYLRFWKFPAFRPIWNDADSAALLAHTRPL